MLGVWSPIWKADLSRVLLIGRGPLPHEGQTHCSFPQLRTLHFKRALESTGLPIRTLLLETQSNPPQPGDGWAGTWSLEEEGPGWIQQAEIIAEHADVLVSAGPYNPGRLACVIAQHRPVWVDIPGDPLAELQALTQAVPNTARERFAAARSAILPVLSRADAISTVSHRQTLATIGQLELLNRRIPSASVPVHTIPIAWNFPFPKQVPVNGSRFRVALVGTFNSWLDHATLIEGLEIALSQSSTLEFCCIGGGIPELPTGGFEAFSTWAQQSTHKERVQMHGWVEQAKLPSLLQNCHAGIWLDQSGDEPLFGSRTRALLYAWAGLQIVGSTRTEIAHDLANAGHLHPIATNTPTAVANTLINLRHETAKSALSRQEWMDTQYGIDVISGCLAKWVKTPERIPEQPHEDAALAIEYAKLKDELATMRATPTWRFLSAAHRALGNSRKR